MRSARLNFGLETLEYRADRPNNDAACREFHTSFVWSRTFSIRNETHKHKRHRPPPPPALRHKTRHKHMLQYRCSSVAKWSTIRQVLYREHTNISLVCPTKGATKENFISFNYMLTVRRAAKVFISLRKLLTKKKKNEKLLPVHGLEGTLRNQLDSLSTVSAVVAATHGLCACVCSVRASVCVILIV